MSRQSSVDMPDATEISPSSKSRKEKSWMLWQRWLPKPQAHPLAWLRNEGKWFRFGRYRTKDEAEKVKALEERKWNVRPTEVVVRGGVSYRPRGLVTADRVECKVSHESEGKPE